MPQEQVLSTSQLPLRRAGETDDSYAHRVQAAVVDHIKTLVKKPSGDTCEWDAMTLAGRLRWLTEVAEWSTKHIDDTLKANIALDREVCRVRMAMADAGVPTPKGPFQPYNPPVLRIPVPCLPAVPRTEPARPLSEREYQGFWGLSTAPMPESMANRTASETQALIEEQHRIEQRQYREAQWHADMRGAQRTWINEALRIDPSAFARISNATMANAIGDFNQQQERNQRNVRPQAPNPTTDDPF